MSPQEKSAVPWLMVCAWNCQNAREIHCQLAGTQKVTWVDLHKMYRLFYNNPSKTVKIPFCVCIISPESACRGKCFSAEKCISAKRFPYKMCLIEAQSQSVMTSFHVAERANSVHVGGGIFPIRTGRKVSPAWMLIRKWVRVAQPSGTKILHCQFERNVKDSTPDDKRPADNSWQLLWCNYQQWSHKYPLFPVFQHPNSSFDITSWHLVRQHIWNFQQIWVRGS